MAKTIHHGHQYTNLRRYTCYNDRIYAKHPKGLIKISLEEGTKAPLRQNDILRLGLQIIYDLCTPRPSNRVDLHPPLKDEISLQKTVTGKDDREPLFSSR